MEDTLVGSGIWGDARVRWEVLLGGEAAMQDTVEVVGERR